MSTVAVDPRIRARRVTVARDAGRRRLRRLVWLGVVLAVAAAASPVTWTPAARHRGRRRCAGAGHDLGRGHHRGRRRGHRRPAGLVRHRRRRRGRGRPALGRRGHGGAHLVGLGDDRGHRAGGGRRPRRPTTGRGCWPTATGRVLARVDAAARRRARGRGRRRRRPRPATTWPTPASTPLVVAAAVPAAPAARRGRGARAPAPTSRWPCGPAGRSLLGGAEDAPAKLAAAAAVLATVTPGCVDRLDVSVASAPALVQRPGVRVRSCR